MSFKSWMSKFSSFQFRNGNLGCPNHQEMIDSSSMHWLSSESFAPQPPVDQAWWLWRTFFEEMQSEVATPLIFSPLGALG